MNTTKNKILILVLILIAGTLWYLESQKNKEVTAVEHIAFTENDDRLIATTTAVNESSSSIDKNASNAPVTSSTTLQQSQNRTAIIKSKAARYPSAVEIIPGGGFINTDPFTLKSLIGKKVILVDFWTYSCINCQRVTPYLNAWYEKYKDKGLVIVGVHTPEFNFEKDYDNVAQGVKDLGIQYPVVQDNNMSTWNAYGNRYWPHEYLIDIDGYIVHDKIGEGGYAESEQALQQALEERAQVLQTGDVIPHDIAVPKNAITISGNEIQSPETYFGAERNQYLGNGTQKTLGVQNFTLPKTLNNNTLYLEGTWNINAEFAHVEKTPAKIIFNYNSKNVYFVASSESGVKIKVLRDGKLLDRSIAGKDVGSDGTVLIKENKLYNLINGEDYGQHKLEIEVEGSGLDAYTFTFG